MLLIQRWNRWKSPKSRPPCATSARGSGRWGNGTSVAPGTLPAASNEPRQPGGPEHRARPSPPIRSCGPHLSTCAGLPATELAGLRGAVAVLLRKPGASGTPCRGAMPYLIRPNPHTFVEFQNVIFRCVPSEHRARRFQSGGGSLRTRRWLESRPRLKSEKYREYASSSLAYSR